MSFGATVCKTLHRMLSDHCLSCLSVMFVYFGQTATWIKIKLGTQLGLGPSHIVLDGDPAPLPKKGLSPRFLAHFYCGQTSGCIKMPLGMEVGLGPGDLVLNGDPAPPPPKRAQPPIFGPCLLWPNSCVYQDTTWYGGRPWYRRHCVRWGPGSPVPIREHSPPIFGQCPLWPNGWMDRGSRCHLAGT